MKKLIYLLPVLALLFTACDPMDDIYATIDAEENGIVGDAEYTLTDADYKTLGLEEHGTFNSEEDVKASDIPDILDEMFPVWGKNSSVLVNYQLYLGTADGVNDYRYADSYSLANMDYPRGNDNAVAFFPEENPADLLADILDANIDAPAEGDNVLAKYKQYIGEPVFGVANYFEEGFNGSLGAWETINVSGANTWFADDYRDDQYAKASGFIWPDALAHENWLISPEIDLSNQTNATLEIRQAINKGSVDLLDVVISTDYTGDHTAATWDVLDLQNTPDGTSWTFLVNDPYALTAYEGETIHIAFRYISTDGDAATWEVDNVVIKVPGIEGETKRAETFYTYSGSEWEASEGVYFVQDADFDSMGEAYGQPGQHNNFGSSTPPDDYLPTFLGIKYPYAAEGDELIVIYDYYSSRDGAQIRGNLYTVIDGVWVGYEKEISATYQYGHDGNVWLPDNTIKYTLVNADYQYIHDQLLSDPDYVDILPNFIEHYNFSYTWEVNDSYDLKIGHALSILAAHLNPTAEEGQKYIFTYVLYDNGTNNVSMPLILTDGVWVLNK